MLTVLYNQPAHEKQQAQEFDTEWFEVTEDNTLIILDDDEEPIGVFHPETWIFVRLQDS